MIDAIFLLAQAVPTQNDAAQIVSRTFFQWGRIQTNADWILPIVVCVAMLVYIRTLYAKETQTLGTRFGWLLTGLRTVICIGLLLFYLQPQWRNEQERQIPSRVLVAVDTSLSMELTDTTPTDTDTNSDTGTNTKNPSRSEQVIKTLEDSRLVARLARRHNVELFGVGAELKPVGSWVKTPDAPKKTAEGSETESAKETPAWKNGLLPSASETRLGQTLTELIRETKTDPVAGILLFSDGGQNAGPSLDKTIAEAREAKIPIFTFGVGSTEKKPGVRIADLVAPRRAFPRDRFTVTGLLQAQGLAGQTATVELYQADRPDESNEPDRLVESRTVTFGADGQSVPIRFEILPERPGTQRLRLIVRRRPEERLDKDHQAETEVEIVDRKNRVLLFAGGPMREYRFLRNQLFRDKSTTVDVLLQTAAPGVSQEADQILDAFPTTRQAMFAYDCLIALDPDWKKLSDQQIDLLTEWVSRQSGGLIVLASNVHQNDPIDSWTQEPRLKKIRDLYPVTFDRRLVTGSTRATGAIEPWPLEFTREGTEATFLQLEDDPAENQNAWKTFSGVYQCYPTETAKSAAVVYARFSDPQAASPGLNQTGATGPIYLAGQFFGSGKVLYLGSAEMWRLRRLDPAYFERFYTELIRHVSEGRLTRGNPRGTLLVERDRYLVGQTVQVRAQLTDPNFQPLLNAEVELDLVAPDGSNPKVVLQADPNQPGNYRGHFRAAIEGNYEITLPLPETKDETLLRRKIQVRLPDLERQHPQRNDAILDRLARETGGVYYRNLLEALASKSDLSGEDTTGSLLAQLPDRTKTVILTSAMDRPREKAWLTWWMYTLCGIFFLEWTLRRLAKLA